MDWIVAAILGLLVGSSEVISRYKDLPRRALLSLPGAGYVCLNGAASLAAYGLIVLYQPDFGLDRQKVDALRWTRVLVAGVGAMAFFRTSLFTVRAGDRDIGIGPVSFLQIFLAALDRAVDRLRAQSRALDVGNIMQGASYTDLVEALPTFCLALMQNLPKEDQQQLANSLLLLRDAQIEDYVKVRILGLYLMNAVGPDALTAAVKSLQKEKPRASAAAG